MSESEIPPPPPAQDPEEPVWTYRGYRLKSGEFVTAMVHFFRAKSSRQRLAPAIGYDHQLGSCFYWCNSLIAFSQPEIHHSIIILNTLLVMWFLLIEARRYRYYELWSYRVRLMETDFYAAMLVPPFHPSAEWAESLAENLLAPSFPISLSEAFGRRLRRNYFWIFLILFASWVAKIWLFPEPAMTLAEFVRRGAIGPISGGIILGLGLAFYSLLTIIAIATLSMTQATGEVLPRFGEK